MLQVLVAISQKFCCRKEARAMQKLFIKENKDKKENVEKKWASVRYIKNNGYSDARLKKEIDE